MKPLTFKGATTRFIIALFLVLLSFNPSGFSYIHWLFNVLPSFNPYLAIAGVVLIIGWVIYIRATLRSLGPIGISLVAAISACIVWLLFDLGIVSLDHSSVLTWLLLIILALMLTVGMCWSHVRRRLSGQVDSDDISEGQ